jgi:nitrous oxide reductase accessory protein NosL
MQRVSFFKSTAIAGMLFLLLSVSSHAAGQSAAQRSKMFKMGEKSARFLCTESKLLKLDLDRSPDALLDDLEKRICHDLDRKHAKAVLHYLKSRSKTVHPEAQYRMRQIPKDQKCPVCGMYPYKYPVWVCTIQSAKKRYYFDGVKDMMKYYLIREKYRYDRSKIRTIEVQDFYSLTLIDGRKAWYVTGSDIRGPMGPELIPFAALKDAETFLHDHHGRSVVRFDEITRAMLSRHGR